MLGCVHLINVLVCVEVQVKYVCGTRRGGGERERVSIFIHVVILAAQSCIPWGPKHINSMVPSVGMRLACSAHWQAE